MEEGGFLVLQTDWTSATMLCEAHTMNGFIVLFRDDPGTKGNIWRYQDTLFLPIRDTQ